MPDINEEHIRTQLKARTWLLYQGYAESQTARPLVLTFQKDLSLVELRAELVAAVRYSNHRVDGSDWQKLREILHATNDRSLANYPGNQTIEVIRDCGMRSVGATIATVLQADALLPDAREYEYECYVYFKPHGTEVQHYIEVPLDEDMVAAITGDFEALQIAYNGR